MLEKIYQAQAAEAAEQALERASKNLQTAMSLFADAQLAEMTAAEDLDKTTAPRIAEPEFQAAFKNDGARTAALRAEFPDPFAKLAKYKVSTQHFKVLLDQARIEWETQLKIANLRMATMKMLSGGEGVE